LRKYDLVIIIFRQKIIYFSKEKNHLAINLKIEYTNTLKG